MEYEEDSSPETKLSRRSVSLIIERTTKNRPLFSAVLFFHDSYSVINGCTTTPKFEETYLTDLMETKKKFSLEEFSEFTGFSEPFAFINRARKTPSFMTVI